MPEYCTCGAQLPLDALFCHKCGKPQREVLAPAPPEAPEPEPAAASATPPPLTPSAAPARITLFNPQAVGVALIAWSLSFLGSAVASFLHMPQIVSVMWLPGGGLLAVYLYRRRTGLPVTIRNGAQLGWLCGTFGFIMAILALTAMVAGLSEPSVALKFRETMEAGGIPQANIDQMLEVLRSPTQIFAIVFFFFVLFSVLPAFGGVIGAKLFGRSRAPQGH